MQPSETDTFKYRQVEQHILSCLDKGTLRPGDRVPSLRVMSKNLGVGLATVNHAYVELERKGVLEARPRSGFFVRTERRRLPTPMTRGARSAGPRVINRSRLIQTVLESVGNKELLPLGVICPRQDLLPVKALGRIMASIVRSRPESLDYEVIPGNSDLRLQLARRSLVYGLPVAPDEVMITAGAMEGLYLALRSLTHPGDSVLIQAPTYYCFLQLLETLGLRVIEIPSDPGRGISPEDVAQAVDRFDIKACILSANFNNPDGSLTSDVAKAEIVRLLAEKSIPLVEDDVSGDMHFGPQRPTTFKQHDERGLVLYCSSFSKTVAPGYRVGWMLPGRFMDKTLEIKATTNVSCVAPTQMAMAEYLATGQYERHLRTLRGTIRSTMQTMQHVLARTFPGETRVTRPEGGLVLWVELPDGVDSVELFFKAREQGIGISPGPIFSTQDKFNSFIRLSCGMAWDQNIEAGVTRLGELTEAMARS